MLSVEQVMPILGLSRSQVCVLARSGRLRAERARHGRGRGESEWQISWDALLEYFEPLPELPRMPSVTVVRDGLEDAWTRHRVDAVAVTLRPRERRVMREVFVHGRTIDELAEEDGCTRQRISFLVRSGARKMAHELTERRVA